MCQHHIALVCRRIVAVTVRFQTMRRMRQESKKPTEAAFAKAFRAAENLDQVEMSKEIFKHRIEAGLPPQEYAYVKVRLVLPAFQLFATCMP